MQPSNITEQEKANEVEYETEKPSHLGYDGDPLFVKSWFKEAVKYLEIYSKEFGLNKINRKLEREVGLRKALEEGVLEQLQNYAGVFTHTVESEYAVLVLIYEAANDADRNIIPYSRISKKSGVTTTVLGKARKKVRNAIYKYDKLKKELEKKGKSRPERNYLETLT